MPAEQGIDPRGQHAEHTRPRPRVELAQEPLREAELLGHRASMRQQLGRQPLGKRAEVLQQDVLLIEPDPQPFPVANRPQRSAKSHAIKSCYDPGDAVLVPRHETLHRSSSRSMRCGKHIMPETGVERFTYSGVALYPPFRATEPQPPRGAHAVAVSTTGLRHRDDLVAAPPRWVLRGRFVPS